MRGVKETVLSAILLSASILAPLEARAFDLTGAWATSADECKNVFVRKGKDITFAPMSEIHGGGFVAEPNQLIGRTAKCAIKARKDDDQTLNMIANCASDIMFSTVQFSVKIVDDNKIQRLFPGMDDMQIFYYRCQI